MQSKDDMTSPPLYDKLPRLSDAKTAAIVVVVNGSLPAGRLGRNRPCEHGKSNADGPQQETKQKAAAFYKRAYESAQERGTQQKAGCHQRRRECRFFHGFLPSFWFTLGLYRGRLGCFA